MGLKIQQREKWRARAVQTHICKDFIHSLFQQGMPTLPAHTVIHLRLEMIHFCLLLMFFPPWTVPNGVPRCDGLLLNYGEKLKVDEVIKMVTVSMVRATKTSTHRLMYPMGVEIFYSS